MVLPVIKEKYKRTENKIPQLRFGMLHSFMGLADGVSIVMQQVEDVIVGQLGAPRENIFYLVGKAGKKEDCIQVYDDFHADGPLNNLAKARYETGFSNEERARIEDAITRAKETIKTFVTTNNIDIIIAHNTCFPANFILGVALSRYYQEEILSGNKTPKYILWWHDSHLERPTFLFPAQEIERYVLKGIPGPYIEHIVFINSLQLRIAEPYFLKLDRKKPGFYEKMLRSNNVIYNTTDMVIKNHTDLKQEKFQEKVTTFFNAFKVHKKLLALQSSVDETLFILQHTRMVGRKRIDFALRFAFALYKQAQQTDSLKKYKTIYFLISGNDADNQQEKLLALHKELSKNYETNNVLLVFAQDQNTTLRFEDYPLIFAQLNGIATYFSEIEGFGNNFLEIMASGLIPIIYEYPVYVSDIEKFGFQLISIPEFLLTSELLDQTMTLLADTKKQQQWANNNIKILKRHLSHKTMARALRRAILLKRTHWRKSKKNKS
ncbi:glycosyltransferase [Candidatus Woesearchaeota archaeon]|nr:glycosyltransferase [Candidatus Woesearchaeota archaeon]